MVKYSSLTSSEKRLLVLLLSLVVILVYLPAIHGGFIFDDIGYIATNRLLRDTDGLVKIWLDPKQSPQYYPLTFTSFWVEFQFWQLWTMGYHITNVTLHTLNALLLLRLLQRLLIPGAWLAAAIFALHPVHVESVAWIAERKNVLSGFFYFLTLLWYLRFLSFDVSARPKAKRRWWSYGLALVFFICALLSKSATCSLPVVILLLIWWKRGRLTLADCLPLIPMITIGVIPTSLTAVLEWHPDVVGATGTDWRFSLVERILIAGRALWFYLFTLVWPTNLIFVYPRWTIDVTMWWQYLFPGSIFVCLVVLAWLHKRIGRAPLATALFFAGTLIPTLGFLNFYFMAFSFVADHFQYLASVGPITLAGSVMWQGASSMRDHDLSCRFPFSTLRHVPVRLLCSGLVLLSMGTLTWKQAHLYTDAETIWLDTLQRNPTCGLAYNNFATEFSRRQEYSRALPYFEKAVTLSPNEPFAHSNLSITYFYVGDFTRALEHGFQAVTLGPLTPQSALYADRLGKILWHKGDLVQAGHYFRDAEQRNFANSDIYYHLGILTLLEVPSLELGGPQDGVARLEKSLQLDSERAVAAPTLAWVLATFPDPDIRDGKRAVALAEQVFTSTNDQDVDVIDTLGAAYAAAERFAEAIRVAEVAVKIAVAQGRPEFAERIQARLELYRAGKPYYDTAKEKLSF